MEATEVCLRANMEKVRLSVRIAIQQAIKRNIDTELREQSVTLGNLEVNR